MMQLPKLLPRSPCQDSRPRVCIAARPPNSLLFRPSASTSALETHQTQPQARPQAIYTEIHKAKQQLELAVKQEDYPTAAKLRDEVKRLQDILPPLHEYIFHQVGGGALARSQDCYTLCWNLCLEWFQHLTSPAACHRL